MGLGQTLPFPCSYQAIVNGIWDNRGPGDFGCYYKMKAHMTLNRTQAYIRVSQLTAENQWVTTAWLWLPGLLSTLRYLWSLFTGEWPWFHP